LPPVALAEEGDAQVKRRGPGNKDGAANCPAVQIRLSVGPSDFQHRVNALDYSFKGKFSASHCSIPARRFPIKEPEQESRRGWAFAQHAPVTYVKFRKSYGERKKATQSKGWRAKRWILMGLQRCPNVEIPLPLRSGHAADRVGLFRFCAESAFMERVMAVKMMKGKLLPIGLDLGTTTVRMAQFSQTEGNYDLIAAASADIPVEKQADFRSRLGFCGSAIKGLLAAGAFVGRECVLGLPAEATFVQHVKIARTEPEQVTTAVLQEVQGKLPFSVSKAEIRHIVVGEVGGEGGQRQQEVIVVAAARETLMASLAMARKAGLDVSGVNIESCAIVECFARLFRRAADQTRVILFVDIGHASTQVVISHGGQIVFARNVIIAGQKFNQEIAEKLGITPNEATEIRKQLADQDGGDVGVQELHACMSDRIDELVGELSQCLLYHESIFRAGTVERVIFLGGQAMDRHLCQSIAQRLNLPAQIGDPLVRMGNLHTGRSDSGLDRRESQPEWAVAVGLSLGGGQAA